MKRIENKGIAELFSPDEFYVSFDKRSFSPGQFCYLPVNYFEEIPRILDVKRDDPRGHDKVEFSIRHANQSDDFKRNDRTLPIYHLNLKAHEELIIHRAKRRPGIILCCDVDKHPDIDKILPSKGKRHLQHDCIFVLPCYGIENEYDKAGFIYEMVCRIQYLMYRQFFYLPSKGRFTHGVLRIDHMQIVIGKGPFSIQAEDFGLSPELFSLLISQVKFMLTGVLEPQLKELRELLLAEYRPTIK